MIKIAVVGTGYVGLVTGTCFAETGNHVVCVDNNINKVASLKAGQIPIYEPGLDIIFDRNVKQKRLEFTTDLRAAISASEIIFLALPTPPGEDGSADLSYILGVAKDLSEIITSYKIIVNKSTVPVGTAEKVSEILSRKLNKDLFDVVSNPEFLREGVAVEDFLKPDRVVIGTRSERAKKRMSELYEPFVRQGNPIYIMDERSSELTKYAANSYLAMRISYMNEIANLCDKVGANVDMVRIGMGSDNRIGKRFLFPGIGYGGSCFPKDVKALVHTSEEYQYDFQILKSVIGINEIQKRRLSRTIIEHFNADVKGKKIAIWGLAFKPNTDDIREAPSLEIIAELLVHGAKISVFDPEAMEHVKNLFGDRTEYCNDMYDCTKSADALAILTEWSVFRSPDFSLLESQMNSKLIFDGRNVFDVEKMKNENFTYYSIGRPIVQKI
jgi:UDPglucose 6-dehydrogenase